MYINIIITCVIVVILLYVWFNPNINIKLIKKKIGIKDNIEIYKYYLSKPAIRPSSIDDVVYRNILILDKSGLILYQGDINITTKFEHLYDLSKEIGTLYISKTTDNFKKMNLLKIN